MLGLFLLGMGWAWGQESLDVILDRGFVSHWLVCGPFKPDVEGGLAGALGRGGAPLGGKDFMMPLGGIARMRPQHLVKVKGEEGEAVWQQAGTADETLNLAPFFPKDAEGIAYAAFYAQSLDQRTVYFNLQSPLGARVWVNGFPARDVHPGPITACGSDQFTATLRPGLNLVALEVPGMAFSALAKAVNMGSNELGTRVFVNRPLLHGSSGYEIALRLQPTLPLGELLYVPRLENTGTFSGSAVDVHQDTWLTFFNPTGKPAPPVNVVVTMDSMATPLAQLVKGVKPGEAWKEKLAIPIGPTPSGLTVPVTVRLNTANESGKESMALFKANVLVQPRTKGGAVFVLSGPYYQHDETQDQDKEMAQRIVSMHRQMMLLEQEPDFGFDLGTVTQWKPVLESYPEFRKSVRDAAERLGPEAGYAAPDERLVGGETLARNAAYGMIAARECLLNENAVRIAWDQPGIAPQTPQILAKAEIPGLISNLAVLGLPPVSRLQSPDNAQIFHRRKQTAPGPASLDELRQMVSLQRREPSSLGIDSDVLVINSLEAPPEPFLMGASDELARAYPSIRVQGAGAKTYFRDLGQLSPKVAEKIPDCALLLTSRQPGSVLAQPLLKQVHTRVENRLLIAERFAAFAALLGADYPEAAMDLAWRQVLYWSAPNKLGVAQGEHTDLNTFAGYREAADLGDQVLSRATAYLARETDTLRNAPPKMNDVTALLVFNPSSWARTDRCTAEVELNQAAGMTLLDNFGNPVPFTADRPRYADAAKSKMRGMRVQFVAQDIPPLGYRTYYVQAAGAPPQPVKGKDPQIENDYFLLSVDPKTGDIRRLTDKRTGTDYAKGPMNQVHLLDEDPAQNNGGRELWTTGKQSTADTPPEITSSTTEWRQQLTISSAFGGGNLRRVITLQRGVPRVDCEMQLDGVALDSQILALSFDGPAENRVPVYGAAFGATVGRLSRGHFDFRSKGLENLSGTGAQPALDWAALSPGDHIEVGAGNVVPLRPAMVVYGNDPRLEQAARDVVAACIHRGLPAVAMPDTPRKPDFLWTDSTEFQDLNNALDCAVSMRIVLGNTQQNTLCARLVKGLDEEHAKLFTSRLQQGVVLLLDDKDVPEGRAPVPTLLAAGLLADRAAAMAGEFADALATRGAYAIPPSAYVSGAAAAQPKDGFAVLFDGARLCSTEDNGSLVLALAHGKEIQKALAFHYAIYPFEGDWRDACIPREARAFNEPLQPAATDLHAGHQPGSQSFLEVTPSTLIVSAVKPAGYPMAAMQSESGHPRNGLLVRAWESTGRPWEGTLRCFTPITSANQSRLLEAPGKSLTVTDGALNHKAAGFAIESLWLLPSTRFPRGDKAALGPVSNVFGSEHSRYWQHNTGAAPLGFQPITVTLRGSVEEGEAKVEAFVSNNLTDQNMEGLVYLQAADGWNLGPAQFYYNLRPGDFARQEVSVLRTKQDDANGGMVAWTSYHDQVYRDVLELNPEPLVMTVSRNESQVKVTIQNKGGIPAEGFLDLIVSPDCWPELGQLPEVTVLPRRAAVSIPPYQSQDVLFRFSDPKAKPWAAVKLAANGHTLYQPLPR